MAQARCTKGHIYDSEIYDHCPYCDHEQVTINFGQGTGEPDPNNVGKSVPVSIIEPEQIKKTVPPGSFLAKQDEIKPTRPVFSSQCDFEPVVAWLVCVHGHDLGIDYRLTPKTNTIGRGSGMDVRIKGDDTISSDTHAKIDYDVLNNDFYLLPANNRNTIYCNSVPVYAALKLNAYDRIRFGQSELLFVPFCNDKFAWPAGDKGE